MPAAARLFLFLSLLVLGVAGCTAGEPEAPRTTDKVWKTLHPEQWDTDPNTATVPAMPKGRAAGIPSKPASMGSA